MEILDVFDEEGNLIGKEERKKVHEDGLWHIHVGVIIMNQKGEILFQKRSPNKIVNPNKWTRTGGHVDSGESPLIGAQRETKEEIGILIPEENFELMGIEKENRYSTEKKLHNRNFVYSYFAIVDYDIKDYVLQKEEVSAVKYITIEEMEKIKEKNDESYTFIHWDNFDKIIEFLKEKRELILKEN
jgi:isopentenyldiphosphate isomerase